MSGKPPLMPARPTRKEAADKAKKDFMEQQNQHLAEIRKAGKNATEAKEKYRRFLIEKGKYFYSLEEVLEEVKTSNVTLESIVKDDNGDPRYDAIALFKRDKIPNFIPIRATVPEFEKSAKLMKTNDSIAKVSSEGHSSGAKKRIWNMDIVGRPLDVLLDSEVAHMLPDAENHALEWYDVACWAMGLYPRDTTWAEVLRMLHGTKGESGRRVHGSGLRHFVSNKARIVGQEKVLDKADPQLLIVPIRTPEQCKIWNGEDFPAIVLVGRSKSGTAGSQQAAVKTIGLTDVENNYVLDAEDDDLEIALESLTSCITAMTQSLVNGDLPTPKASTTEEQKCIDVATGLVKARLEAFKAAISIIKNEDGEEVIVMPNASHPGPKTEYRAVCKIWFSNKADSGCHPPVDPILLLARAAVVWSVRFNFRLRASAISEDECDEEELEEDLRQLQCMSKAVHDRQLQQYVEGMGELVVERQRSSSDDDDDDDDNISSMSFDDASHESCQGARGESSDSFSMVPV